MYIKKITKLLLLGSLFTLGGPYVLSQLNFYGPSYATQDPALPVLGSSVSGPVSYAEAVERAAPAVVSIKTTKQIPIESNPLMQDPFFRHFFGEPNAAGKTKNGHAEGALKETLQGLGSGVIVSDKGYILTNNHVIKEADTMIVTLADGRTSEAKLIGSDPDTDLAVLQIKLDKLPVITLGSSQKLRTGDVVLAIGNPFGLDNTVTQGIVSATERAGTDLGVLENLIQTDAAINVGNSGGALIEAYGRLVGINTAIYSRTGSNTGIGFAIPIDQATHILNQLIEGKRIIRGYLGIMMQALTKEIQDHLHYKENTGAYIRAVVQGSPAQKAGLLPGDVIIKINHTPIKDEKMAFGLVANLVPGQSYPIDLFRKGEILNFTLIAGERKPQNPSSELP